MSEALSAWESRGLQQRAALEGLVGSTYARAWEGGLRALLSAAGAQSDGARASRSGGGGGGGDCEFLDCPAERRLMWRLLLAGREGARTGGDEDHGGGGDAGGGRHLKPLSRALAARLEAHAAACSAASADPQAKAAAAAVFRRLLRAVEKRAKGLDRDAAGHEVSGCWQRVALFSTSHGHL